MGWHVQSRPAGKYCPLNVFFNADQILFSECASPHSPEVRSPVGLGVLPSISPLVSTPIDVPDFDIPEARQPLPDSPPVETLSPVTVVLEVDQDTPQQPELPTQSVSPLSASESSVQSYITSPQEPPEEYHPTVLALHSKSVQTMAEISPVLTPTTLSTNPNPLHCRACLADTCDDITASMCGHIFCNRFVLFHFYLRLDATPTIFIRCITDAVIKTNRCPVCMTPTLLYCLFRLDLAA